MLENIFDNDLTLKCHKWVPYFKVYEQYLSKFVGKSPVVVEVGVQGGGSIQMWRKYFGDDAEIYGIDIDDSVLNHLQYYDEKIKLFIGDQADPNFWDSFLKYIPKIDVFIDDGGHSSQQQFMSFIKAFPHLNYGGVYICEDIHTNYPGMDIHNSRTFMNTTKTLIDIIHYNWVDPHQKDEYLMNVCEGLYSVNYYNSMVVLTKEKLEPFVGKIVNDKEIR